MTPRQRSVTGLVIAMILVPIVAGLLACMPVPIGDPERSRVDPALNGIWVSEDFDSVWIFQPYDKRTWLIRAFDIADMTSTRVNNTPDVKSYEELVEAMEDIRFGDDGFTSNEVQLYKAWHTKIKRQRFITWQGTAYFDAEGMYEPEMWLVWKIGELSDDSLALYLMNGEYSGFKGVDKTRRAYERVVRKNVDDPELYSEDPLHWIRVRDEHLGLFSALADEILADPES